MSIRWRRHRHKETVDLNITAFMNLMVILVPFLLITAVFSRMAVLELNLPSSSSAGDEPPTELVLEITVRQDSISVGDRNLGTLKAIPNKDDDYDLKSLSDYLKRVKARYPDKTDATLLLEPDIPYDVLVQVMDSVRLVEVVQATDVIKAELFPEISIGDAPVATNN